MVVIKYFISHSYKIGHLEGFSSCRPNPKHTYFEWQDMKSSENWFHFLWPLMILAVMIMTHVHYIMVLLVTLTSFNKS